MAARNLTAPRQGLWSCHCRWRGNLGSPSPCPLPRGTPDRTSSGSDEVDAKGLVNDPGGANEETPSSESLPNMGSSENMTRQAEQTLKSTGTPMTPDKLFLAM